MSQYWPWVDKSLQPLLWSIGHACWSGQRDRATPPPGNDPSREQNALSSDPQRAWKPGTVTKCVASANCHELDMESFLVYASPRPSRVS